MYDDLIKAGIKPENIIFMAYTSNLSYKSNPFKGMIFTDPAPNTDGDWAKYGCFDHVDYTDKDINKKVFLGILSGDAEAVAKATGKENPKVLAAGPEDTVFTYFIDHGSEGLICVGDDDVTDEELISALKRPMRSRSMESGFGSWRLAIRAPCSLISLLIGTSMS